MNINDNIVNATKLFESVIRKGDLDNFRQTKWQDVLNYVHILENEREESDTLCDFTRIERLLTALQQTSRSIANLSPSLHHPDWYLWGPVKLILEIANDDDEILEEILDAYQQLSSAVTRLSTVAPTDRQGSHVLSHFYNDILEYHGCLYTIFRRNGWQLLFKSSWKELQPVLASILHRLDLSVSFADETTRLMPHQYGSVNLSGEARAQMGDNIYQIRHATFVSPEMLTKHVNLRETTLASICTQQKVQKDHRVRECMNWLNLDDQDRHQASLLSHSRDEREKANCGWILNRPQFKSWLDLDSTKPFLWLTGKPGAGKTTLATYIIENARLPADSTLLYYICSRDIQESCYDIPTMILGVMVAQILRQHPDVVSFVYETYVMLAEQPTLKVLELLKQLLGCLSGAFIVVDGFDELDRDSQKRLWMKLEALLSPSPNASSSNSSIKVLVTSQDIKGLPPKLAKQPTIALLNEHKFISQDIKIYVKQKVDFLEDEHRGDDLTQLTLDIVRKADGMFLWAKLVLDIILDQASLFEMRRTLNELPSGLVGIYKILLRNMEARAGEKQRKRMQQTFFWLIYARRPLKAWEICDALVIGGEGVALVKHDSVLNVSALDICKPFIEVHKDQTVSLVHFSIKEFLLSHESGPMVQSCPAHEHISRTCLRYFLTCGSFFEAEESLDTCRQIVLGMHNLFPYTAEVWQESLRTMVQSGHQQNEDAASAALRLLREDVDDQLQTLSSSTQSASIAIDSRMPVASARGLIQPKSGIVITELFRYLSTVATIKAPDSSGGITQEDPVRKAFAHFQTQFEQLKRREYPNALQELGVDDDDLSDFHYRHSRIAFLCRIPRCSRALRGFEDAEERCRHEKEHLQMFLCPEADCDFHQTGFRDRRDLRYHVSRYHHPEYNRKLSPLILAKSTEPQSLVMDEVADPPRDFLKFLESFNSDWDWSDVYGDNTLVPIPSSHDQEQNQGPHGARGGMNPLRQITDSVPDSSGANESVRVRTLIMHATMSLNATTTGDSDVETLDGGYSLFYYHCHYSEDPAFLHIKGIPIPAYDALGWKPSNIAYKQFWQKEYSSELQSYRSGNKPLPPANPYWLYWTNQAALLIKFLRPKLINDVESIREGRRAMERVSLRDFHDEIMKREWMCMDSGLKLRWKDEYDKQVRVYQSSFRVQASKRFLHAGPSADTLFQP